MIFEVVLYKFKNGAQFLYFTFENVVDVILTVHCR